MIKAIFSPSLSSRDYYLVMKETLRAQEVFLLEKYKKQRKDLAKRIHKLKEKVKAHEKRKVLNECKLIQIRELLKVKRSVQYLVEDSALDCMEIIYSITEEIIQTEIKKNKKTLIKRIQRALDDLSEQAEIIAINPDDHAEIAKTLNAEIAGKFDLIEDSRVPIGNALVIVETGTIEVSWENHLQEIKNELQKL